MQQKLSVQDGETVSTKDAMAEGAGMEVIGDDKEYEANAPKSVPSAKPMLSVLGRTVHVGNVSFFLEFATILEKAGMLES